MGPTRPEGQVTVEQIEGAAQACRRILPAATIAALVGHIANNAWGVAHEQVRSGAGQAEEAAGEGGLGEEERAKITALAELLRRKYNEAQRAA